MDTKVFTLKEPREGILVERTPGETDHGIVAGCALAKKFDDGLLTSGQSKWFQFNESGTATPTCHRLTMLRAAQVLA